MLRHAMATRTATTAAMTTIVTETTSGDGGCNAGDQSGMLGMYASGACVK